MDFEQVLTVIEAVSNSELTRFKYEENGVKLQLSKEKEQVRILQGEPCVQPINNGERTVEAVTADVKKQEKERVSGDGETGNFVKSPLVGMFYAAPSEDAQPFVKVGDTVKKGQTLAIVEAMKLMNEIESEFDGEIAEILVENGQPVEYGQPLFRIC